MKAQTRARIAAMLRSRSRWQWFFAACAFTIIVSSFLDHLGAFGYVGNDWKRFDQKSFRVARCIDGDTIVVLSDRGDETIVHMLGVDAPELPSEHWAQTSAKYTTARTVGRSVTLRLEPIQSRSARGELLAYIFITDGDNLNADIVRDGQAYADRRVRHSLAPQFQAAENEARKKPRGVWIGLTEDQMPGWRREWLRSLHDGRR
jgi:endonuclease YncB( thermonuclease family)